LGHQIKITSIFFNGSHISITYFQNLIADSKSFSKDYCLIEVGKEQYQDNTIDTRGTIISRTFIKRHPKVQVTTNRSFLLLA